MIAILRDAHGIIIGRYESEVQAYEALMECLKDQERRDLFSVWVDGKRRISGHLTAEAEHS